MSLRLPTPTTSMSASQSQATSSQELLALAERLSVHPDKNGNVQSSARFVTQTAHSLATSIRLNVELLAQTDKRMFLDVASDIRKKSREIEDTMLGEDHPHARFFDAHRNDPFLDEIKAMELSENVSD